MKWEHFWEYFAPDQTAAAVALVFAQTQFGEPREPATVGGHWRDDGTYVGSFKLKDGVRTYRIEGRPGGMWTVGTGEDG